eukprot:TRINITY_DN77383_c0_g1_i1.p2 TRINITY_DN77383_c0_g1~~TRINITY_DN77383_c0_g1_i1.p2  ORF type:complete len:111 (+),score=24.18 TRINITY_DN77383_c0_g1_i1:117-449(+)
MQILNWIDYIGLATAVFLLAGMALPPSSRKVVELVNMAVVPILGLAAYAFVRWQWSLTGVASTRAEFPSCEDKVEYYRTLRNVFLDFSLLLSLLMAVWVARLKAEERRRD